MLYHDAPPVVHFIKTMLLTAPCCANLSRDCGGRWHSNCNMSKTRLVEVVEFASNEVERPNTNPYIPSAFDVERRRGE